jgi:UPF0755 protein
MSDAPEQRPEESKLETAGPRDNLSRFFRRRVSLRSAKQALQPDAPPPPPPRPVKRREGVLSIASGFLSFLLVLTIAGVIGLVAVLHKLREPGPLASEKVVYIAPRSDVPEILAQLEREGVIDNPLLMNIALLAEGGRSKLKPGEYLFKQHASLREVMDELVNGRQILHAVTIPEGLTTEQILARLRENDVLAGDVPEPPKEGALLPETYKVARGYPRAKLLAKMQEDQRKLVERIWSKRARDLPVKTPFELITLASIIEKETGRADERPRVAAVFVNRLRKGMRLQSDPTIVYGLVGGKATLGRGILKSEVEKWTPYNTYAIDGLPPGPIANPGKAALEAAANPSRTQDLYFVADGTGGHVFAETLEQHQRNVQRWRQIERDQKENKALEVDRLEPGTTITAPLPPKEKRSDAGERTIGRLVAIDERRDDYPRGLRVNEHHGALKRLGAHLPAVPPEFAGDNETALRLASGRAEAERRARPIFTTAFGQPLRAGSIFAESLLAVGDPDAQSDELADAGEDGENEPLSTLDSGYPVSTRLRADQRARAARLGLPSGVDDLPADSAVQDRRSAATAASETPALGRAGAFDASEGTALDPLRDKSWDLNSPKNVPNMASYR